MQPLKARFIPCARRNGFENMAIDEYLAHRHEATGVPVFRIYVWAPTAITLGRYQQAACLDLKACRDDGVDIVRRITGGGAILHDREVTYSLVCAVDDHDAGFRTVPGSFEILNRFLIMMYRKLGLRAAFAESGPRRNRTGERASFCFSASEACDIVIEGRKIGGNAQRRMGRTILQHGSIPLSIDRERIRRYFPEEVKAGHFAALDELIGAAATEETVIAVLKESYQECTGSECIVEHLIPAEEIEIREILNRKYLRTRWNLEGRSEDDEIGKAAMAQ